MQKQKLFVTGVQGFVGQHVRDVCADYICIPFEGDVTDDTALLEHVEEHLPDKILHLAALAPSANTDFDDLMRVNVWGTKRLYDAVVRVRKENPAYNPRIVFVSSAEVYGTTLPKDPLTEAVPLAPAKPYALSKAFGEHLGSMYAQQEALDIVIARPFAHTGPGQQTGFFVPDMASQIVAIEKGEADNPVRVGNLTSVRDYLDVRDVVEAYRALLTVTCHPGEVFLICSGKGIKMNELLDMLISLATCPISTEDDPQRMRPHEVPYFVGDHTKLTDATGWTPKIPLEKTLVDALEYWRGHASMKHEDISA